MADCMFCSYTSAGLKLEVCRIFDAGHGGHHDLCRQRRGCAVLCTNNLSETTGREVATGGLRVHLRFHADADILHAAYENISPESGKYALS